MSDAARRNHSNRFPLAALLTANAISQTGNLLSYLAIPWFVLAAVNLVVPLSMLMLPGYRLLGKQGPPPAASSALAGTSSRTT